MAYGDDNALPTDAGDASRYAEQAIGLWGYRNDRMAQDHRAWSVAEPDKPNRMQLSDSHAQIEAAAQLMAGADMQIRAVAHDDPSRAPAQQVEDWCRAVVAEHERRFARRGGGEWKHVVCWSAVTRGWIIPRVLFNPSDDKFPFSISLLDPMEVYPVDREDMEHCIVHRYDAPLGRLWREWGKARVNEVLHITNDTREPDPTVTHEVTAFYTATEFGVLVDNKWLKKPVRHGYPAPPVGIFLARGTPFRGENQALRLIRRDRGDNEDRDQEDRWIGTSLIHAIRIHERDNQNVANLEMDLLKGAARPLTVVATQAGSYPNIQKLQEPNATADLKLGEAIQRLPPEAQALQFAQAMRVTGQGNIWQAGLNQQLMGGGENVSGYERYLLGAAGARVLKPYMAAYARFEEFVLGLCAQLYSRFGSEPMPYLVRDRYSGQTGLQKIAPWMLFNADFGLEVMFGELGTPDLQVAVQNAVQLLDRSVVSQEWALDNLLHIDNPQLVIQQARRDQFYKDPAMLRLRMLQDKMEDTTDPRGAQLAAMLFQKVYQEFTLEISTPPQPPQQPPLPGSAAPSAPGNGQLPNELMQMGMAPNAPAPPGPADLAAGIPALAAAAGLG